MSSCSPFCTAPCSCSQDLGTPKEEKKKSLPAPSFIITASVHAVDTVKTSLQGLVPTLSLALSLYLYCVDGDNPEAVCRSAYPLEQEKN